MFAKVYKILILVSLVLTGLELRGQTVQMVNNTIVRREISARSTGTVFDDGGSADNYSDGFRGSVILETSDGSAIVLSGNINTESCCDKLTIRNSLGQIVLGPVSGRRQIQYIAVNGFVEIHFESDNSVNASGFALSFHCLSSDFCNTSCHNKPTAIWFDSITSFTAIAHWDAPDTTTPFLLRVDSRAPISVVGNSYRITALSPGEIHNIEVEAVIDTPFFCCRLSVPLRTKCGVITEEDLSYVYDFENAQLDGSGSIDSCWTRINSENRNYPKPIYLPISNSKGMVFSCNYPDEVNYLVMPEYVGSMDSVELVFDLLDLAVNGVQIGLMESPVDTASFVLLTTINENSESIHEVVVPMMSVDDRHFIAFRTVFPLPPNLYIDNVRLRKKSLCPRVLNLHLEAVSTSSIIVAWDNPPDTLPVPSYYEIVVRPEGGDSAITTTATRSPVTISGLYSISGYWLKIRSYCDSLDYGLFDSIHFSTICNRITCDSSGGGGIYNSLIQQAYTNNVIQSIFTADELSTMGLVAGPLRSINLTWSPNGRYRKLLYIFLNQTTNTSYMTDEPIVDNLVLVHQGELPVGIGGPTEYMFDSPYLWDGVNNLVLTIILLQPVATYQDGSSCSIAASLTSSMRTINSATSGTALQYNRYNLSTFDFYPRSFRPNVSFSECVDSVLCQPPVVMLENVTNESVELSWLPGSDETAWRVSFRMQGETSWTVVNDRYLSTYITISGLRPAVKYEFKITALCDSGETYACTSARTRCNETIGFEYDNLNAPYVTCRYGSSTDSSLGIIDFGPFDAKSRHTVHTTIHELDSITGNRLHVIPDGYCSSVRLGNKLVGAQWESITYSYTVDTTVSDLMLLKYAAVMQNPGHDPDAQPRFTFRVTDSDGRTISTCYDADFVASSSLGWNESSFRGGQALWKDWTTVGVDLTPLHGQTIQIEFRTYDCKEGGHFAYAYFVLDLTMKTLTSTSCNTIENTFTAPLGFNYRWYTEDNPNRILSVTNSLHVNASGVYCCRLSFIGQPDDDDHNDCSFVLKAVAGIRIPYARFGIRQIDTNDCLPTQVQMLNRSIITSDSAHLDSIGNSCETYLWRFDDGTTSTLVNPIHVFSPGTHLVSLYAMLADGSCIDSCHQLINAFSYCNRDTLHYNLCPDDTLKICGLTITLGGEYQLDSIVDGQKWLIHVIVHARQNTSYTFPVTSCSKYYWPLNGQTYYTSGTYTHTITNHYGCDSVVTLDLHFEPVFDTLITDTLCLFSVSGGYHWRDTVFYGITQDTVCYYTTLDPSGCDSLFRISLHINPSYDLVVYDTLNCTDTLFIGPDSLTQSGTYRYHFTSVHGCDSIVLLHLFVRDHVLISKRDTLCGDDTILWRNLLITEAGFYSDSIPGRGAVPDSVFVIRVAQVYHFGVSIDMEGFCEDPPYYILKSNTSAPYTRWYSSATNDGLSGHENDSIVRLLSLGQTCILVADHGSHLPCPSYDTVNLTVIDNVKAVISTSPSVITSDQHNLTALSRSKGRISSHQWFVWYNNELVSDEVRQTVLQLDVPYDVDSIGLDLAVSSDYCADTAHVNIAVFKDAIYFPNVFTPGQSTNNLFRAYGNEITSFELWIYDRRGTLVFHTSDIQTPWDGTYNGLPCQQGSYAYKCRYSVAANPDQYQNTVGTVTLLH